jgi:outer membrane receptor protein involved in Fe transport
LVTNPYDKPTLAAAFPQYQGAPYYYKFYNSIPRFFRTGSTGTTSLNAAGSTPTVNYNMSYSYTDDQGYIINNGLRKNSFGFGGTAKLTNKVTISSTFNYVMTDQKSPPTSNSDGNGPANTSVFGTLLFTPTAVDLMGLPYENPLDHSSIYYRNGNDIQNPRWTLYNAFTKDNVNRIFGQISAMYDIAKGINLMYRVGLDNYTEYQEYSQNKGGVSTPTGILRTSNGVKTIWDQTVLINFNRGLGNDFNLTVNAGGNKRSDLYSQTGQTSEQQLVYGIMNNSNFVTHKETTEDGSPINYDQNTLDLAVFGVASLGYRDYLYMTLGGRNSWKSTVEMNNRSIFYPNVSLSFIPTSAIAAFQNSKTVNYLKLRVGYSTSANFPPPYKTRAFLLTATNVFQTSQGTPININAIPNLLPNPDLKPELLKEAEAGIEGRFFKNRISLDLTFYSRVASNQILDRPLDPSTGYGDVLVNAGQVSNKGIELQLGATIVQTKDWKWELTGLYSLNKSLVSKIPADLKDILIAGYSNEGVYARNGSAYGVIEAPYFEKDPKSGKKIVDPDGNYIISNDIGVVGDPNALYKIAGISTLTYKSFSFGMQWNYTAGGDMYSTTSSALLGRGVTRDTEFDRAKPVILPGVLQTTGQPNNIQVSPTQAYYTNNSTQQLVGEASIFDATCIRLREASLSYNLPQKALAKLPFGSASISISGSNLWYYAPNFPKYVHFDPEAVGLGVGNGRGMEFLSGPSARRFGASIRVTF